MQANNQQLSLANLNFGDKQIIIYGTQQDPMIKCTDLMVKALQYNRATDARWFRDMTKNEKYVCGKSPQDQMFTEMGIYIALMKSNKPIAEQFQEEVCNLLKQIRLQTIQQLEETKKQLEDSKQNQIDLINQQPASIYQIKRNNQVIYIGQDQSITQSRLSQHFNERQKIIQQYQYIDIVLATMNLEDIEIIQNPCLKTEADELEKKLIQEQTPLCNQALNQLCIHKCKKCNKEYKSRGWLSRHQKHNCDEQ